MTFVIEKGVAVPLGGQGSPVYPWRKMELGDSIFVPADKAESATRSGYLWAARNSAKMTVRSVSGGVRIWRVA